MEKIFDLYKDKVKLKVEISETLIATSWMHYGSNEFTNKRKFQVSQLQFAFDTVKPVCSIEEINSIEKFMFKQDEGTQISLF
jgi:hypothetical protein